MSTVTQADQNWRGWLDNHFEISARGTTVATEVLAGVTTFLVAAYIIFVNPSILSFSGIPDLQGKGPAFAATLAVTCLTAGIMTLAMGFFGKYPFMMAPGMGLNAVVAFQLIVGSKLTWQEAMGVITLEGLAITILVLIGFREAVMDAIPLRLKRSIAVGIGFFIALIGLVNGGIVRMSGVEASPVAIGNLATATFAVTAVGLLLTAILEVRNVKGSLLLGIIGSTIFAIILNAITGGTMYANQPGVAVLPSAIVSLPDFSNIGAGLSVGGVFAKLGVIAAVLTIFSLMLSDFFDTMGTLIGVGEQGGFVDQKSEYPPKALRRLLLIDSIGAFIGGLFGASSNTTYIESAAGVSEGGRTGFASIITGLLFLAAMFFAPIAGVIPAQATAPALIIVGFLMFWGNIPDTVRDLSQMGKTEAVAEGLPALLTMILMPMTYSITNGIGAGFITYSVLQLAQGKRVHWVMWVTSLAFIIYYLFAHPGA
ncbi:MAG: NCS2 family permease [Chloroflexi bacterium]|nr:NCS2 family permease [Chloroflexota bacterium]